MKKRILSILLTVVMILSILPAGAAAAGGGQSSGAVLKMHVMRDNKGSWSEKFVGESIDWAIYERLVAQFYLHYADESTKRVDPQDLDLPDFMDMEPVEGTDLYRFTLCEVESGCITYTENDEVYQFTFRGTLPRLGLYSDMPFERATLMETVTIDEEDEQFYIALQPDFVTAGSSMTSVVLRENERNLSDVSDIQLSADGAYATVTVTDSDAVDGYFFSVNVDGGASGPSGQWSIGVDFNNNMPGLYFCYPNERDGVWTVDTDKIHKNNLNCCPGGSEVVCFYFGTGSEIKAGNVDALPLDALSFPDYMDASKMTDENPAAPENSLLLEVDRFNRQDESTEIVYEYDGKRYAVSAQTILPDIGFYSTPEATKGTYIYEGNPFAVTDSARDIYLCVANTDHFRLEGLQSWSDLNMRDAFEVTPSVDENGLVDGRYLKFSLKEGEALPEERLGVRVNYQYRDGHDDSWRDRNTHVWTSLENHVPVLLLRWLQWDEARREWFEPQDQQLQSSAYVAVGDEMAVQFYYGTADDCEKVDPTELSFPTDIISAFYRGGALRLEGSCYEGSGVITYPAENARMRVQVVQPDFGFYSASSASEQNFLGDKVEVSKAGDTFYVVAGRDRSILKIEAMRNINGSGNVLGCFDVTVANDGSYAAFTVKEDDNGNLPAGGEYNLEILQDWGTRYVGFELIRTDLSRLETPSQLTWHREYFWEADDASEYEDRMGFMSFFGDAPTQNRYAIEVYSVTDNGTVLVEEGTWHFGDLNKERYYSSEIFVYSDPDSGTYRFRVKALGDGINYRDSEWSDMSDAWSYTAPANRLDIPDETDMKWTRTNGQYAASWKPAEQTGMGYYEVYWYYEDAQTGVITRNGGTFDIPADDGWWIVNGAVVVPLHDDMIEACGNVPYYFKVRAVPADITQYRMSLFTGYSPALDVEEMTELVNDKLDGLISAGTSQGQGVTVEQVQMVLAGDTADLRTAMAADQDISGGQSSGTLELIRELEQSVVDNVEQKVEAKNSAPQQIKDIAADIEMVGATLNWADKHPESGQTPDVTLTIDQPKNGIVLPEVQHNAVQFSMKLHGAIDANDKEEDGQQLIVPIVIDMPVPASINPKFLVVLHQMESGDIEQLWPYVYWDEGKQQHRATFVIDSFSDFALVEYDFRFDPEQLTKTVGSDPFTVVPVDGAPGCTITYTSSDSSVAEVDPVTGEVTVKGIGTAIITAAASATELYPKATASYTLTVTADSGSGSDSGVPSGSGSSSGSSVTVEVNPFADVASDDFCYDAVLWAVKNNITNGLSDTAFGPGKTCTRAEAVTFLWRAAGCPEPKATSCPFTDVNVGAYYYDAVLWAVEKGITNGTGDGTTFSPNADCTRAQIVSFIYRNVQANGGGFTGAWMFRLPFTDTPDWAYEAIAWCYMNDITNGTSDTTFSPDAVCTRAQIVTFLWRGMGGK